MNRRYLMMGAIGLLAGAACSKKEEEGPKSCTDTTGLSADEIAARNALAYSDSSPEAGKACNNCQQFVAAPAANQCGTCKVMKGPVHPKGYCKAWAAKPA
jgi:hypothetical protein